MNIDEILISIGCPASFLEYVTQSDLDEDKLCYIYAEHDGVYLSKLHFVADSLPINGRQEKIYWAGSLKKNDEIKGNDAAAFVLLESIEITGRKLLISSYSQSAKPLYEILKSMKLLFPFYQRTLSSVFFLYESELIQRKKPIPLIIKPLVALGLHAVNIYNQIMLSLKLIRAGEKLNVNILKNLSEDTVEFIDDNLQRDFSCRNGYFFRSLLDNFHRDILDTSTCELKKEKIGFIVCAREKKTDKLLLLSYCLINGGIVKVKYLIGQKQLNTLSYLFKYLVRLVQKKKLYGIEVATDEEREILKQTLAGCITYTVNREKESLSTIKIDESMYDFQAGIGDNIAF